MPSVESQMPSVVTEKDLHVLVKTYMITCEIISYVLVKWCIHAFEIMYIYYQNYFMYITEMSCMITCDLFVYNNEIIYIHDIKIMYIYTIEMT